MNTIKLTLSVLFILTNLLINAQINLKAEDVNRYREKQLIVVVPEDKEIGEMLKTAFDEKWSFNKDIIYTSFDDAKEMSKESPNTYLTAMLSMTIAKRVTTEYWGKNSPSNIASRSSVTVGDMMDIHYFEDDESRYFRVPLQSYDSISSYLFMEGVQRSCQLMSDIELLGTWNKYYFNIKNISISELKDKVLLVPIENVKHIEDTAKLAKAYPYTVRFVPMSTVYEKIENSDPNFAYIVVLEMEVNMFFKFLCTTENSKIYAKDGTFVQQTDPVLNMERKKYITQSDMKNLSSNQK